MKRQSPAAAYLRGFVLAVSLAFPIASLAAFGSVWLWQQGYLIVWALAAFVVSGASYLYLKRLFLRPAPASAPPIRDDAGHATDPSWSPREQEAWRAVLAAADRVDPMELTSRDDVIALGLDTIGRVARTLHPEVKEPLWQFTLPEALCVIEQVSRKLRPFIRENIPLGDQLTVGQAMRLYRWRSAVDLANRAYDLWRILRLANPLAAATQEAREALTKKLIQWGRDQITRRLAEAYVLEVGRAAIDLYGGRLRVEEDLVETHVTGASRRDRASLADARSEPLRVLIVGRTGVGKSSLVNALMGWDATGLGREQKREFSAYDLVRVDLPPALVVESPGVDRGDGAMNGILSAADTSDLILWVTSALAPDAEAEGAAMERMHAHLTVRGDRKPPPIIVVMAEIDRLPPVAEWAPPYNLAQHTTEKSRSINKAAAAASERLRVPVADIVPVALGKSAPPYNIDTLWAKITEVLPEARQAQLLRVMADIKQSWNWRRILRQAVNARRLLSRSVRTPS